METIPVFQTVNFHILVHSFHWQSIKDYINPVNWVQLAHFMPLMKFTAFSSTSIRNDQLYRSNAFLICPIYWRRCHTNCRIIRYLVRCRFLILQKEKVRATCTAYIWLKINQNLECRIPPTDIFTAILLSSFHVAYAMQTNGMHFACFKCFLSLNFHASLLYYICAVCNLFSETTLNVSRKIASQKILLYIVIIVIDQFKWTLVLTCEV